MTKVIAEQVPGYTYGTDAVAPSPITLQELEALKIRLELGDRLQIARSQSDLATLYLVKQKYVKARDLDRKSVV